MTARVVLEPLAAAHADAMFGVLADNALYRYLDSSAPRSADDLRATYARLESRRSPDGSQLWLNWVIRPHAEAPIGFVQATVIADRTAWIAYLVSVLHQGRGYAREATGRMLEHLTDAYRIRRFLATVEADNRPSIRLLEALGLRAATTCELRRHHLTETERLFVGGAHDAHNAS